MDCLVPACLCVRTHASGLSRGSQNETRSLWLYVSHRSVSVYLLISVFHSALFGFLLSFSFCCNLCVFLSRCLSIPLSQCVSVIVSVSLSNPGSFSGLFLSQYFSPSWYLCPSVSHSLSLSLSLYLSRLGRRLRGSSRPGLDFYSRSNSCAYLLSNGFIAL